MVVMKVLLLFTLILHARSAPTPEMKIIIHLHEGPAPVAPPAGVAAGGPVAAPAGGYGGAALGGKDYLMKPLRF